MPARRTILLRAQSGGKATEPHTLSGRQRELAVGRHIRSMPAHGRTHYNRSQNRVGSAQKPSARAHSGALPSLRSNAQMGAAGRIDRAHTRSARFYTAGALLRRVLSASTPGTEKEVTRERARQFE